MRQYQKVMLKTDKYISKGIKTGDIGIVLEDYDEENCEVEFFDDDGITIALFTFPIKELEVFEEKR